MTSFSVKFNGEGGGWRPHTSVDCPLVPSKLFSHTVCGLKYILYSVQYSIEVIQYIVLGVGTSFVIRK